MTQSDARTAPRCSPLSDVELERVEIDLLLEGIHRVYGYDFRDYARASLKRRVWNIVQSEKLETITELQAKLLHDPDTMERFLFAFTVNVTSMFRDPEFFVAFREKVVPLLRTYPFIRVWHAGCSTGEEVYSMAILLQEEGLYDRCRIYATDMNESVLRRAREGIFSGAAMAQYAENYVNAGGKSALEEYYTRAYGNAIFRASLRRNLIFCPHNLATDGSINEFNVILCRNVMIYFNKPLQNRVHELLYDSLSTFGILGLGTKETLHLTPHERDFEPLVPRLRLYRRIH